MNGVLKKYIGDRPFYNNVIRIILPLIIQQGITQFVNLLDNLMVGSLGTIQMSGVAIVNQIVFIFNLAVFGGLSGVSIFGAQFYGKGDYEGLRHTIRFRIIFSLAVFLLGVGVFLLFGEPLIKLYLSEKASSPGEIAMTLSYAKDYMYVTLLGLLPFAVVQCFSSVLKDAGETVSPMIAGIIAITVNLTLNYLLIFGNFGFPKLGVVGAALATAVSRFVEAIYLLFTTYRHRNQYPFFSGVFKSLRVPVSLVQKIALTGTPLLLNEILWSVGTAAINMCYASRGLSAVAATNINATVWNLFSIVVMSTGNAIGIMSGQLLGAGEKERAKDTVRKLLFFTVSVNLVIGIVVVLSSPFIPLLYNTEAYVRLTAAKLLTISGIFLPISAYSNGAYFTIRSGGKTFITFLFDCMYTWLICFTAAFLLSRFTSLSVVWMFLVIQCADIAKALIGGIMIHSGIWANNVVE